MVVRIVALLLALAMAVGAVVGAARASWIVAGLLAVGAVAMGLIAARLWRRALAKTWAPGYVERERSFY